MLGLLALSAVATVINVTLAAVPTAAPLLSAPPRAASAANWHWNPYFGPEPSPADRATAIQWLRRASSELQPSTSPLRPITLGSDIAFAQAVLGDAEGFKQTVTWLRPRTPAPLEKSYIVNDFFILGGAFAMVGDEAGVGECIELTKPIYGQRYTTALKILALAGRDQEILSVMPHGGWIEHTSIYIRPAMIARRAGHASAHDRLLAAGEATIETEVRRLLGDQTPRGPGALDGVLSRYRRSVSGPFVYARIQAGQLDAARTLIEKLRGSERVEQFCLLAEEYYDRGDRAGYDVMMKQAIASLPEAMAEPPPSCFDDLCYTEVATGDVPAARRHLQILRAQGQRAKGWQREISEAEDAIVRAFFHTKQDELGYAELEIVKRKRHAQGRTEEFSALVRSIGRTLFDRHDSTLQQFAKRYPLPDDLRQEIDEVTRRASATRPAAPATAPADMERQLAAMKDRNERAHHLWRAAAALTGIRSVQEMSMAIF